MEQKLFEDVRAQEEHPAAAASGVHRSRGRPSAVVAAMRLWKRDRAAVEEGPGRGG